MTDMGLLAVVATFTFLLLAAFILFFFLLFQRRQEQNLQEKQNMQAVFQQEILQTQIEIQNQTLQRVGEELHDNIGQLLSVAKWQLNMTDDEPTPPVKEALSSLSKAINALRALSKSLDADVVADFGLVQSLRHELARIEQTGKCRTHLYVTGEAINILPQKEMVLFRIAQEALNNALKHAQAQNISVRLQYTAHGLLFEIEDDGRGFVADTLKDRPLESSGAGLRNIQRRAELIGGRCVWESNVGQGTRVRVSVGENQTSPTD